MPWWLHTALGAVVVGTLVAAAWRAAGRAVPDDRPLRCVAAVVLLWLGAELSGLATRLPLPGGDAVAGSVTALVLAGVAWRAGTPAGGVPRAPAEPLEPAARAMLVGVGTGVLVLVAVILVRPVVGFDGLLYHLGLPAAWVPQGALAGLPHVVPGLPVEAYPVGMEVVIGWLIAVTGSTAAAVVLSPMALGTLVIAVWTAVRRLGGSVPAAWGAVASVAFALPALVDAGQVHSDVLATALMACGTTLAIAGARRMSGARTATAGDDRVAEPTAAVPEPTAAVPESSQEPPVVRDGADLLLLGLCGVLLSVGVKTTTACGVLVLVLIALPHRRGLRARVLERRAWAVPLLLAAGCGGIWLARNLVLHGHPSWPLLASSFGDPVPPLLATVDGRFIDDPVGVLRAGGTLFPRLAWIVVPLLLAAAVLAVRARGPRRWLAVCGLVGAAAWTIAPATGITSTPELAAGAVRYLLPCWTLLAVAAWAQPADDLRGRRAVAVLLPSVLLVQGALAVAQALQHASTLEGTPLRTTLVGLAAGAGAWAVASIGPRRAARGLGDGRRAARPHVRERLPASVRPVAAPALVAVVLVAGLLVVTPGFWERHADALGSAVPPVPSEPVVAFGGTPAWSLGPYGRPGSVLVDDCATVAQEHAAGRTVAVSTSGAAARCTLPGTPVETDGFRVWSPTAGTR